MEYSTDQPTTPPPAQLDSHPAADLFPLLEVESPEFGELVRDIQEQGLLQPIVLQDGLILDGRNRYRACQHAGVEPRFVEWSGGSPTAYVLSLNLHRRHLTDGQKAMIAADALPLFEAEARDHQRAAGREFGRGIGGKLEANLPQPSRRAPQARDRAAAATGVSGRTVQTAKAIKEKAPDLADQLRDGTMSPHRAAKEVERREGRPAGRRKPRAAAVPEPAATELDPQPETAPEPSEVRAPAVEQTNGAGRDGEPADRNGRLSFEAIENADQVAQREQFARLCTALVALPLPTQFLARHDGELAPGHIEPARAAQQWLTAFVTNLEPEPQPPTPVTWTLDGFLHHLIQVNGLMERHGAEIAELLANRISPGPDIAIVRAALALLGELERAFGLLECGAGRD